MPGACPLGFYRAAWWEGPKASDVPSLSDQSVLHQAMILVGDGDCYGDRSKGEHSMTSTVNRSATGIPGNILSYQGEPVYPRASRSTLKEGSSVRTMHTFQADDQRIISLPPSAGKRKSCSDDVVAMRPAKDRSWAGDELPPSADVAAEEDEAEEPPQTHVRRSSRSPRPAPKTPTREEVEADGQEEEGDRFPDEEPEDAVPVRQPASPRRAASHSLASAPGNRSTVRSSLVTTEQLQETERRPVQRRWRLPTLFGLIVGVLLLAGVGHLLPWSLALSGAAFLVLLILLYGVLGNWQRQQFHPLLYMGICALLLWVGYLVAFQGYRCGFDLYNDAHYGVIRTFQVDAVVGHHDSAGHPTHLIALNLHGRIEIIEFQGGDPAHSKIYVGPQLTGPDAQKAVVTLSVQQGKTSGKPNLLVDITGEPNVLFAPTRTSYLLANTGEAFKPQQPAQ